MIILYFWRFYMTMHLEGPWLSTTGRRKGKAKWRSSEQKKQAEQLAQDWQQKTTEWKSMSKIVQPRPLTRSIPKLAPPPGRETPFIPSHDSGVGNAAKKAAPVYTGDKIVGIGTMHKSNAVPIFSNEDAKAISSMRR
jgi:hypothetical protein